MNEILSNLIQYILSHPLNIAIVPILTLVIDFVNKKVSDEDSRRVRAYIGAFLAAMIVNFDQLRMSNTSTFIPVFGEVFTLTNLYFNYIYKGISYKNISIRDFVLDKINAVYASDGGEADKKPAPVEPVVEPVKEEPVKEVEVQGIG